ncbi:MAG TPA: histidine kinase [Actinomycetota bacterium]|nr:histidine kinase [Actinomycetota bacterium]
MMITLRGRLPWLIYGLMLVLLAITAILTVWNDSFEAFVAIAILMMLGYGTVGALVASRIPSNPLGWLMLTIGLGFVLVGLTSELVTYGYVTEPSASVPFLDLAVWLSNWVFFVVFMPIPLILLLFPTGRVHSPRWRWVPAAVVAIAVISAVAVMLNPGPVDNDVVRVPNPTGVESLRPVLGPVLFASTAGLFIIAVASVVALFLRFRRASGDERQQIRWLAYLAALACVLLVGTVVSSLSVEGDQFIPVVEAIWLALFACIGVAFPVAIGLSIIRHGLFDLDLVIKRTAVFAVLVASLMVVGGVATLLIAAGVVPSLDERPPLLLLAGVLFGLLLLPLYRFSKWLADRLVFGGRSTPYEVLTEFSGRVGSTYSSEDVLPRMAQLVGDATRARSSRVWLRVGRELQEVARWPADALEGGTVATDPERLPDLPGEEAFEIRHQGELLGALSVEPAPSDPMTPAKRRIVQDLASQAGFVLRNVRLIEELRASRQRLVAAQDEERRRLERNIHDGAQQQLVALTVKLRLLEQIAGRDPAKASELAGQLQAEATAALDDLRDLARGIYPPLLADKGLPAALEAQARKSPVPVSVDAVDLGRFSQDVEAAIYFSCLEALQNVTKYAEASLVEISLDRSNGRLSFAVTDDGVGFDPASTSHGSGLQGIADRLDALGGTFEVVSTVGVGTAVNGSEPVA